MSKVVTWGALLVWSLVCWAAMGLIDIASGFANNATDTITQTLPISESLARSLIDLADDLSEAVVIVTWLAGVLLILGGSALIKRIMHGAQRLEAGTRAQDEIVTLQRKPGQDHWTP